MVSVSVSAYMLAHALSCSSCILSPCSRVVEHSCPAGAAHAVAVEALKISADRRCWATGHPHCLPPSLRRC
eukprot:COSAG01_NODE_34822_length_541_cov_1.382353_1_plen_70_part_01